MVITQLMSCNSYVTRKKYLKKEATFRFQILFYSTNLLTTMFLECILKGFCVSNIFLQNQIAETIK